MGGERDILDLYVTHRGELVNYANGILGDAAHAEDVVQEAWLRFGAAARGRVIEEPVGYLYRIVRNLAIDGYRRKKREGWIAGSDGESAARRMADEAPSPEVAATSKEELRLLREAMAELPERTRIALEMRRFGGYKLKDIAGHLGLSVATTHEMIAKGIAHCRRRVRPRS